MKFAYLKKGEKKMTPYEQLCNHVREGKANIDVGMFRGIRVCSGVLEYGMEKKFYFNQALFFYMERKQSVFLPCFNH